MITREAQAIAAELVGEFRGDEDKDFDEWEGHSDRLALVETGVQAGMNAELEFVIDWIGQRAGIEDSDSREVGLPSRARVAYETRGDVLREVRRALQRRLYESKKHAEARLVVKVEEALELDEALTTQKNRDHEWFVEGAIEPKVGSVVTSFAVRWDEADGEALVDALGSELEDAARKVEAGYRQETERERAENVGSVRDDEDESGFIRLGLVALTFAFWLLMFSALMLVLTCLSGCEPRWPSNREVGAPAGADDARDAAVREIEAGLGEELPAPPDVYWFEGPCLDYGDQDVGAATSPDLCAVGGFAEAWGADPEIHVVWREPVHDSSLPHELFHWALQEAQGDQDQDHEQKELWLIVKDARSAIDEMGY